MQPKNAAERKKRILTFAGLYAASLILMFFIFSAFGVRLAMQDQGTVTAPVNHLSAAGSAVASNEILHADSLLHAKLHLLQQADDEYTLLLADSASLAKRNYAAGTSVIYEAGFKKTIDSIEQVTTDYVGEKATTYKNMLNSFKDIINNRQALKNIQASMASGKTTLTGSQQDMLQWKADLARKDNELAKMDAALKAFQDKNAGTAAGAGEAQQGETALLKTAFEDQSKEYIDFKEKYNRLKADNGNLAAQIIELRKSLQSQTDLAGKTAEGKINTLEQQVQDLNADLYFAKVDCNLTRADAQQLISNARQRKELLSESLSMLNSLAASGDAGIQKKAKEKIARLNHIATTLHD